ncbi:uncharacterized protein LOC144886471 [Branchiostoma floridae x Branchiostoma japonicum]
MFKKSQRCKRNALNLVSCPADTRITVNSPDGGLLDWTDPEFRFQPSNELANHECSANKGDAAAIGTRNVLCWAEGFADGTTCDFDIVIEAPECVVPTPPLNGAVTCGVTEGAQKYCSISCSDGYDFAVQPADVYRCGWHAVWHPAEDLPWPDCSRFYRPGRARQKNELYYYSGPCAFNEEIKRDFLRLYTTLGDCSAGIRCGVTDIEVTCHGEMSTDEEDTHECDDGTHSCHAHATCSNTPGGHTCACNPGYRGDGYTCADEDECTLQIDNCDEHATCANTPGSYTCACFGGFSGDGYTCTDDDECAQESTCDEHATCNNTLGSYTCACNEGYTGDGNTCTERCSSGFEYWNEACYYLSPNRKSFFSAERDCDSRRAKLAVVPDSATHQYLIENAKSKRNIWIRLSDRGQEGEFVWSNGDSLGSFHHWKGHNFPRAHCVAMMKRRGTYVLGVKLCAANCNYFCQRTAATNP